MSSKNKDENEEEYFELKTKMTINLQNGFVELESNEIEGKDVVKIVENISDKLYARVKKTGDL